MSLFSFLRWWRASPPISLQLAAPETEASRAPDVAAAASGDELRAAHSASTAELWRHTFGITGDAQPVPAGHTAVVDASRAALKATNLADRYFPRRPMLMPEGMCIEGSFDWRLVGSCIWSWRIRAGA